jgi:glutamine amidotransferase
MDSSLNPRVAIVDYGMGNVFSVMCACACAGLRAFITSDRHHLQEADGVILPGVGAFKDAMESLIERDLVSPLKDVAASGRPLFGICLGMQLLMTESLEFGCHRGLNVIEGQAVRLRGGRQEERLLKVPHIGWSRIRPARAGEGWDGSPLSTVQPGSFMYFVHSFHVQPVDAGCRLAETTYGDEIICSSIQRANVFACQFHPERSGPDGLEVYRGLAARLQQSMKASWING